MTNVRKSLNRGTRMRLYVDPSNPESSAMCDRCGQVTFLKGLSKDMQFRGGVAPVWSGFLVCGACLDVPNIQDSRQVIPPDPVPNKNPRMIIGTDVEFLATEDDDPVVTDEEDEIAVQS